MTTPKYITAYRKMAIAEYEAWLKTVPRWQGMILCIQGKEPCTEKWAEISNRTNALIEAVRLDAAAHPYPSSERYPDGQPRRWMGPHTFDPVPNLHG